VAFYRLEKLIRLYDGYLQTFRVAGVPLLLIQDQGQRYLLRDQCPHKDFPLHTGSLRHGILRCAYHGMEFNLRRGGQCLQHPTGDCVKMYPLIYEGDSIGVDLD